MRTYRCPECGSGLDASSLSCTNGHVYHRDRGIPVLLKQELMKELQSFLKKYDGVQGLSSSGWTTEEQEHAPFYTTGPRKKEWAFRRKSYKVVRRYFDPGRAYSILEIGPWNGWLSHLIVNSGHNLLSCDYFLEPPYGLLSKDVFDLTWDAVQGDIATLDFTGEKFDRIIVNHCIHFMPDPDQLIRICKSHLRENGKILVLGSPYYTDSRQRQQEMRLLREGTMKKYHFDLLFRPAKGFLDTRDLEAFRSAGMKKHHYPGHRLKNLLKYFFPSRPVFYYYIFE